jgi:hypothetical protein
MITGLVLRNATGAPTSPWILLILGTNKQSVHRLRRLTQMNTFDLESKCDILEFSAQSATSADRIGPESSLSTDYTD